MKDIMIDIETMGTKSYSSIIAIGAVEFDIITGETGDKFYKNISLESCIESGLTMDASTILFWMKQSKEAQNALFLGEVPLKIALLELSYFIEQHKDHCVWGNSAAFDLGLLANAHEKCSLKLPWKYWQERDVRTLVAFNPALKKAIENDLPHDAISDCLYQIKYCSAIYNTININI